MTDLPLLVAGAAGVVSFLSPCVLPLLPGYIAYLAGTSLEGTSARRRDVFFNSLAFVLGFSLVFALLGVALNTLLEQIAYDAQIWMSRIGGIIIVLFGLFLMGILRVPFLERDYRPSVRVRFSSRPLTSALFGAAFAAGWTPCVGAVLGSILGLAATAPGSAFTLLLAYAIGFGLPFLLVGIFTIPAARLIARAGGFARTVNRLFGALLVLLGILIFTGTLNRIASFGIVMRIFGN